MLSCSRPLLTRLRSLRMVVINSVLSLSHATFVGLNGLRDSLSLPSLITTGVKTEQHVSLRVMFWIYCIWSLAPMDGLPESRNERARSDQDRTNHFTLFTVSHRIASL